MWPSECLSHCFTSTDCHFMKAFGLYDSHNQSCTHSSKGCLVYAPYFYLFACWNIRHWAKLMWLSDCLNRCVARASWQFMVAQGLYYTHIQSWTHSSNDYFVHGPHFYAYACWNNRNWAKFMWLSDCLNHCIARADCRFNQHEGLYYTQTQSWTHRPKGYLVHGPYFYPYAFRNIGKFVWLSNYLNHFVARAACHLKEA